MVAEATRAIPWDHFLSDERVRLTVEGFRRADWPNIKRLLSKDYGIDLPEGLEPCWVEPGKAIYWQAQMVREPVTFTDDKTGHLYRDMVERPTGWLETSPLPANNASQIAHYLKKGLRLRHPDQVAVEMEPPVSLEEPAQAEEHPGFLCDRHGIGNRRTLKTWKSYIQHCQHYKEIPEHTPPPDVLLRATNFEFFCFYHGIGFATQAGAARHRTVELKKPGKSLHPTVDEMRVSRENNDG